MYADYSFYTGTFYGTAIKEADFPRFASRASDFLDYYTRGKAAAVEDEATLTALAKACCAVAEQIQADETAKALGLKATQTALASSTPELKSETVGSYSVGYATASDYVRSGSGGVREVRAAYAAVAQEYLATTGLLYRGAC